VLGGNKAHRSVAKAAWNSGRSKKTTTSKQDARSMGGAFIHIFPEGVGLFRVKGKMGEIAKDRFVMVGCIGGGHRPSGQKAAREGHRLSHLCGSNFPAN
jgi:hypothetical protein